MSSAPMATDHGRILPDLILQQLLGHLEKLIEVHGVPVAHVRLNFLLGLGVFGGDTKFFKFDLSVFGFAVVEGLFDLYDLVLVEPPVQILLHLEVLEPHLVTPFCRISHQTIVM